MAAFGQFAEIAVNTLPAGACKSPELSKDESGQDAITFWGVKFNNTDVRRKVFQIYIGAMGGFLIAVYFLVSLVDPTFPASITATSGLLLPIIVIAIVVAVIRAPNPNQNLGDGLSSAGAETDSIVGRMVLNESGLDGMVKMKWIDVLDVFMKGDVIVLSKKKTSDAMLSGNKLYLTFNSETDAQLFYDNAWKYTHL